MVITILHKFYQNDPIAGEEDSGELRKDEGKELREKILSLTNSVLDEPLSETKVLL